MSTKYIFKHGDLVQVKYGNEPIGVIIGEPKPCWGEGYILNSRVYTGHTNYLEYSVMISDIEETHKYHRWYWRGGLYYNEWYTSGVPSNKVYRDDINPLIAHIHPIYLTLLSEA